jgi:hypothetical protein
MPGFLIPKLPIIKKEKKQTVIAPAKASFTPYKRPQNEIKATAKITPPVLKKTVKPVQKAQGGSLPRVIAPQIRNAETRKQLAQDSRKTFKPSMQGNKTANIKSAQRAGIEALQSTADMGIEMGKAVLDPASYCQTPIYGSLSLMWGLSKVM